MHFEGIAGDGLLEKVHDTFRCRHVDKCFEIVTGHIYGGPIDGNHLNHAAPGRQCDHLMLFAIIGERDLVSIRVCGADGMNVDFYFDTGRIGSLDVVRQAFVIGFPAEEPAEETHIRSLAFVCGGE